MESGTGLHGKAGIKKVNLMTSDAATVIILDLIKVDLP
jgi:hypothetical protein